MRIETPRRAALACRTCWILLAFGPAGTGASAEREPEVAEHPAALEPEGQPATEATAVPLGTPIEHIVLVQENIFDLSKEGEDNWLYRTMNKLHIVTRPNTIRRQLLFSEGQGYDPRLIEESERILRENKYLFDAAIRPVLNADGELEIDVRTRDVWTLTPEISYSRGGGENKTRFGIEESNLMGTGRRMLFSWEDDVDRRSKVFEYYDRQLAGTWTSLGLSIADNSDGHSHALSLVKPFHALDARWAGGATYYDDDRVTTYYDLGDEAAEFRHERQYYVGFGGFSDGLKNGWVRRFTLGAGYDNNEFGPPESPDLPVLIPENRKLVYPFVGFEMLEDRFEKSLNSNQIDRAEDFYLGTRVALQLGWSDEAFGADRDALLYTVAANHSIGTLEGKALLLAASLNARHEDGGTANSLFDLNATFYWRQSDKWLFYTQLVTTLGQELDDDTIVELGGDNGLRGYPLRYQSGESRLVASFEQRYFTDWYPFRLVRVGAAVFADVGRVQGPNALGTGNLGWLTDVGIGLRFAPTRLGTTKVFHLDVAFPLDGTDDIDQVQVLFRARRGF